VSAIYSPSEVAQVLRINEETVRRAIRNKQLTALRIGDQYRLSPTDLGLWIGMDRYLELFRPLEDAVRALGVGGLNDDEADALALEAVHAVRASSSRFIDASAPKRTPRVSQGTTKQGRSAKTR
jgi:excisionase family DNA binding protein